VNTSTLRIGAAFAFVVLASTNCYPAVLDFEVVHGTRPGEGMVISNQFAATFGMTFTGLDGTNSPIIVQRGAPRFAFTSSAGDDTMLPANTHDVGEFFLGDPLIGKVAGPRGLVVRFDPPVSSFSLYILDLDDTERVTLTAYASEAATSGLATNVFFAINAPFGDGLAGFASITAASSNIHRVEIKLQDNDGAFRAAFDDFSSDYVPPIPTPARLDLHLETSLPRLTIWGDVGRAYRIDYVDNLENMPVATNWVSLTNIFLPTSPYFFFDSTLRTRGFYRAVGMSNY
jgi:hypothetical protein